MKIIVRIVLVLAVLLVALFVTAQVVVNRPFFREKITKIASDKLQRDVSLSGLGISIFPSIGLNLKEFNINEKDKKTSFVSLQNLKVSLEFLPLLKKRVVVKEVVLDKPKINVELDASGNFNFSDLIGAVSSGPVPSEGETPKPAPESQASSAPAVSVESIRINGAEFSYKEALPTGKVKAFQLKGLDLGIDDFSFTSPVTIRVSCAFGANAELKLEGKVGPLGDPFKMDASVEVDLKNLNSSDVEAFIPKDVLQGRSFENLTVKGNINGSLSKGIAGDLGISLKLLPENKEIVLKGEFEGTKTQELILKSLTLNLGQAQLSFKGKVGPINVPQDQMMVDLELDISGINDKEMAAFMPKDALQGMGFENLYIKGKVQGSMASQIDGDLDIGIKLLPANKDIHIQGAMSVIEMQQFMLNKLEVNVGSSDVTLTGELQNLKVAPKGQLTVSSNLLDADDFLALEPQASSEAAQKTEKEVAATQEVSSTVETAAQGPENPLFGNEMFQNTQFKLSTNLKKVQAKGNILTDVILNAILGTGIITFEKFSLNTFDGNINGKGVINLQTEKIGYDLAMNMDGISLQKVSRANLGEEKIQGTLTGQSAFKGLGLSKDDLKNTLAGNAKVEVKEGKILGQSLKGQILQKMDNPLLMQFLPGLAKEREAVQKEETPFKDFIIDVTAINGKANLQKMNLTTNELVLRGTGVVDFDLISNLEAHAVFSKEFTETMTGGKDLSNMLPYENGGLHITVKITGPLTSPTVMPDLAAIITALGKGQITDRLSGLLGGGKEGKDGKEGKSNPLSNLLGGSSKTAPASEGGETSQKSNPIKKTLGGLFGGNKNSSQSQDSSEGTDSSESSNNPLKKFKLF